MMECADLLKLLSQARVKEALEAADSAKDKEESAKALTAFALTLYSLKGHPDLALAMLKQSLMLKYDLAQTHFNLGVILSGPEKAGQDPKNTELAKAAYRNAIKYDPENNQARYNLGLLEFFTGKKDEASSLYGEIIEKAGDIPEYRYLGALLVENERLKKSFPPDDSPPLFDIP